VCTLSIFSKEYLNFICREPAKNIPQFMITYYTKTGKGAIPSPRVAGTRKKGEAIFIAQ
jgi:hypothetical protein